MGHRHLYQVFKHVLGNLVLGVWECLKSKTGQAVGLGKSCTMGDEKFVRACAEGIRSEIRSHELVPNEGHQAPASSKNAFALPHLES